MSMLPLNQTRRRTQYTPATRAGLGRGRIPWRRVAEGTATHGILLLLIVFAIGPLLWTFSTAFKTSVEILGTTSFLPQQPTLDNFKTVIQHTQFPRWFLNSMVVSVGTTLLAIAIGSPAGYALSRWRFRGRSLYANALLVVQMFPSIMILIPLYLILSQYHLINTLWALLVTYLTFALAFSVLMLKGYFDGIPPEIEQAALIDGTSKVGILWRIILPLAGPGIVTVAVFAFLSAWNELFFAFILLASPDNYTLMVGMYNFNEQYTTQWGLIMAAGVLTTLPVLAVFFLLQRALQRGLVAGAVRG